MGKAFLALEDGTVFEGVHFGAPGEVAGEVVFNTAMTGYQEIITDPSYAGQIVVMTYPLIGNYGVNVQDHEAAKPALSGFAIRNLSPVASNWRKEQKLEDWLGQNNTVSIEGIDTRKLTTLLRDKGALKGIVSTETADLKTLVQKAKDSEGLVGRDLVKEVTCAQSYAWEESPQTSSPLKVVAVDCGMKANIARMLTRVGCQVTVVPATVTQEEIEALNPDGLFISNGPGDPEGVPYLIETVRACLGKIPIFGICLGHQILGLALGGSTYKLKFGHHGANHPILEHATEQVEITSQNHGFCLDPESFGGADVEVTHINLNDKTCAGIQSRKQKCFSVQYHPEASPGPHDSHYLFDRFVHLMREGELP